MSTKPTMSLIEVAAELEKHLIELATGKAGQRTQDEARKESLLELARVAVVAARSPGEDRILDEVLRRAKKAVA